MAGSHPQQDQAGIATDERLDGKRVAYLRAQPPRLVGFGTLMQMIAADAERGKRVRVGGSAKAIGVDGWAGLWLRVDGPEHGQPLAFDNVPPTPASSPQQPENRELAEDYRGVGRRPRASGETSTLARATRWSRRLQAGWREALGLAAGRRQALSGRRWPCSQDEARSPSAERTSCREGGRSGFPCGRQGPDGVPTTALALGACKAPDGAAARSLRTLDAPAGGP